MNNGAGVTVAEAIREATTRLAATSDTARLDAELLMAHALGVARSDVLIRHMGEAVPAGFTGLIERRGAHEPIAYITGEQEFCGLQMHVEPGVLIPRGDSETLIEAAREAFENREPPASIVDLGTGSGALLFAALSLFPHACAHGVDASREVAPTFLRNLERHAQERAVGFLLADWHEAGWAEPLGTFDLVLCNPPYVEDDAPLDPDVRDYEPDSALFAGKDGLDDYRTLIPQIRKLMNPEAVAIFEIGHSQAAAVIEIAQSCGFAVEIRNDLANRPRCAVLW